MSVTKVFVLKTSERAAIEAIRRAVSAREYWTTTVQQESDALNALERRDGALPESVAQLVVHWQGGGRYGKRSLTTSHGLVALVRFLEAWDRKEYQ